MHLFVSVNLCMPLPLHLKTMWVLYEHTLIGLLFCGFFGYIQTDLSCCWHIRDDPEGKEIMWTVWTLSFGVINTRLLKRWLVSLLGSVSLSLSHRYFEESIFRRQAYFFSIWWISSVLSYPQNNPGILERLGFKITWIPQPSLRKGCHSLNPEAAQGPSSLALDTHLKITVSSNPLCLISLSGPWGWLQE